MMSPAAAVGGASFWMLAFSACSVGMLVSNKVAVMDIPHPTILVLAQLAFAVVAVLAVPALRNNVRFGSAQAAWTWAASVSILFSVMILSSLWALKYTSPTVAVLVRNCAPILALGFETAFLPRERIVITLPIVASLMMCLFGAKLYTIHSPPIDKVGFVFLVINVVVSVADRTIARHYLATQPLDISKTGLLLLNNGVALLPVLLIILSTESFADLTASLQAIVPTLTWLSWANLLFSCVAGLAIGYSGFMLQSYVTASSFLASTVANKAIVIVLDAWLMSRVLKPYAIAGCVASLVGSVSYTVLTTGAAAKGATVDDRLLRPRQSRSAPLEAEARDTQ